MVRKLEANRYGDQSLKQNKARPKGKGIPVGTSYMPSLQSEQNQARRSLRTLKTLKMLRMLHLLALKLSSIVSERRAKKLTQDHRDRG